jgi:hypothetical protein
MQYLRTIISAFLLTVLCSASALAAPERDSGAVGWHLGGQAVTSDQQFVTIGNTSDMSAERALAATTPVVLTDGGANGSATISLTTVPINLGGTNGVTAQAGLNNLMNFGTKATEDIIKFDGTNWTNVAKGANGTFWGVSGGVAGYYWPPSGAGTGEAFITVGNSGTLAAERAITAGTGVSLTDGGANSTYTIAVDTAVVATTNNSLTMTNKTLTSPVITTPTMGYSATAAMLLRNNAASATHSLKWSDFTTGRTINIPDPGANCDFILSESAQTKNGVLTLGSAPVLSTGTVTVSGSTITFPTTAQTLVGRTTTDTLTNKTLTSPHIGTTLIIDGSSNNYTITPNNPAAGRAITLVDPGGSANWVMSTGTLNNGGVMYTDGSTMKSTAVGSSPQVLMSSGTSAPTFGHGVVFGGSGVRTLPTSGTLTGEYWQLGDWTSTNTITCNRCRLHIFGNFTLSHAMTVNTEMTGPTAGGDWGGGHGTGLAGGTAGFTNGTHVAAPGGAGHGGAGGRGASDTWVLGGSPGAGTYSIEHGLAGSSGGTGYIWTTSAGTAGAGGGSLYIEASGNILINTGANITATGGNGGAGGGASDPGGSGGSGGGIDMRCGGTWTLSASTTISVAGGNGGAGGGATKYGAGGGGGGIVFVRSGGAATNSGTVTVTGGSAGSSTGAGVAAAAGSSGVSDIVGSVSYSHRTAP